MTSPSSRGQALPPAMAFCSTVYRLTCRPSASHSPHASQTPTQSVFFSGGHAVVNSSMSWRPLCRLPRSSAASGVYLPPDASLGTASKVCRTHSRYVAFGWHARAPLIALQPRVVRVDARGVHEGKFVRAREPAPLRLDRVAAVDEPVAAVESQLVVAPRAVGAVVRGQEAYAARGHVQKHVGGEVRADGARPASDA